jgi:hypothetical protein
MDYTNPHSQNFVAGTQDEENLGIKVNELNHNNKDLTIPVPNANFYITVTGEVSIQKSRFYNEITHNICDDVKQICSIQPSFLLG